METLAIIIISVFLILIMFNKYLISIGILSFLFFGIYYYMNYVQYSLDTSVPINTSTYMTQYSPTPNITIPKSTVNTTNTTVNTNDSKLNADLEYINTLELELENALKSAEIANQLAQNANQVIQNANAQIPNVTTIPPIPSCDKTIGTYGYGTGENGFGCNPGKTCMSSTGLFTCGQLPNQYGPGSTALFPDCSDLSSTCGMIGEGCVKNNELYQCVSNINNNGLFWKLYNS